MTTAEQQRFPDDGVSDRHSRKHIAAWELEAALKASLNINTDSAYQQEAWGGQGTNYFGASDTGMSFPIWDSTLYDWGDRHEVPSMEDRSREASGSPRELEEQLRVYTTATDGSWLSCGGMVPSSQGISTSSKGPRASAPVFYPWGTSEFQNGNAEDSTLSSVDDSEVASGISTPEKVEKTKKGRNKMPRSALATESGSALAKEKEQLDLQWEAQRLSTALERQRQREADACNDIARLKAGLSELVGIVDLGAPGLQQAVQRVIEDGWDNISWNRQYTALHRVADIGRPDVIRLLLALNADPSIKDSKGRTAIDIAKAKKNQSCVEVLTNREKLVAR